MNKISISTIYVNYLGIIHRFVIKITGHENAYGRKYGGSISLFVVFQTMNISLILELINIVFNNELYFLVSFNFIFYVLIFLEIVNTFFINNSKTINQVKEIIKSKNNDISKFFKWHFIIVLILFVVKILF